MVRFHKPTALLGLCCCFWQQPASAHDREGSVFLTSGQGGSVKRISVVDSTDTPCWMPDGRSILYVAHTSSENTIHLVSTSGEKLLTVPSQPWCPRFREEGVGVLKWMSVKVSIGFTRRGIAGAFAGETLGPGKGLTKKGAP